MQFFLKIITGLAVFWILILQSCSVQQFHDEPVYSLSIVSFSPHSISGFTAGDGSVVNFSVTIKNTGSDITNPASVFCLIGVTNVNGMAFSQLTGSLRNIAFDTLPTLFSGQTYTFTFSQDISKIGWIGGNYFYAMAAVVTNNTLLTTTNSQASVQFNSSSTVSILPSSAPYNWNPSSTVSSAGGAASGSATAVTAGHWCTNTLTSAAPLKWYSMVVTAGYTYQVFWDDCMEGSSSYNANVQITIYDNNGTTVLDSADSAYFTPRTVRPSGSPMYIVVTTNGNGPMGGFAFGIK